MALKIKPPKPPQETTSANSRSSSPVAPAYSPITPKVQPALPVGISQQDGSQRPQPPPAPPIQQPAPTATMMAPPASPRTTPPNGNGTSSNSYHVSPRAPPPPAIPEAQYIPPPPPQPFSSEDNPDAIALRAAISSLQFQKQKAAQDLRMLSAGKPLALAEPERFRRDLAAGKLKEQKPKFGDIRAILDSPSDEDDDDDEVVLGAQRPASESDSPAAAPEIPDSQPSRPASGQFHAPAVASSSSRPVASSSPEAVGSSSAKPSPKPFLPIPGPQDVVRMPPINWEKYHIVGEPLDIMHEQQRRWPGSAPGQGIDRGREHAIAAPYSPFYDRLNPPAEGERGRTGAAPSATGTVSEHPMETRRTSNRG